VPYTIDLFMWGFQSYFRTSAKVSAESLFQKLDPALDPRVLLVGTLVDDVEGRHPLCVDPEDGEILLGELEGLSQHMAAAKHEDPEAHMFQSHPVAEENRQRRVERKAFANGVARALNASRPDRVFFACFPHQVEHHLVTTVLNLDRAALERHSTLQHSRYLHRFTVPTSLIGAAIEVFLATCSEFLSKSSPGSWTHHQPVNDVLRKAGRLLMENPGSRLVQGTPVHDLFDRFSDIAALRYEGSEGQGRVLITDAHGTGVQSLLRVHDPVPFRSERAARKLVEMATSELDLLATPEAIYGLGTSDPDHGPSDECVFEVAFLRGNTWEVSHDGRPLMRVVDGIPELPGEPLDRVAFETDARRVLGDAPELDIDVLWLAVEAARGQRHGTLLVVSTGAVAEARRLAAQSTPVHPAPLTPSLVDSVSAIDGAILADLTGTCHAIGVILDGLAAEGGDPGRGARFNSAHRYVTTARDQFGHRSLAVVVSEDGMVNVLPALRPQLCRAELDQRLEDLRRHRAEPTASRTLYLRTVDWLRKHRFYLSAAQCDEVNDSLVEIEQVWVEEDPERTHVSWGSFEPHPEFDESYLLDDT
jgi:hypothetical protein